MTTSNASAGSPPCAAGSVSGPITSMNSTQDPGQPWVKIRGVAAHRVLGRRRPPLWYVLVDQVDLVVPLALDARVAEVGDGGELPRGGDLAGHLAEECGRVQARRVLQVIAQRQCLHPGDGHALGVHRVEAAYGVAHDQQAVRETGQLLVVAPDAGRELEAHWLVDRLRVLDVVVVEWKRQRPDVGEEALVVGRRMVT